MLHVALAVLAFPDPGDLVSDRPDFTESTPTIAPGWVQVESGYTFTAADGVREHGVPEMLVRVGLSQRLELRLAPPGFAADARRDESGWTDGGVGFKLRLLDGGEHRPAVSVIGQMSIHTNDADFGGSSPEPEVKVVWSYDLSARFSLAGNLNLAVPEGEDGGRYLEPAASLSLGVSLTERVGMYTEYFGFYPVGGDDSSTHYMNGGFTFLVTPNLQLDARVGVGLGGEADDLFAGVGLVWRF